MVIVAVALVVGAYAWALTLAQSYYVVAAPTSSVFSSSPDGFKVLFDYLGKLGVAPKALEQFDDLPTDATIVMAGPFQKPPTTSEIDAAGRWVRGGGRLLLVGQDAEEVLRPLKIGGSPSSGEPSESVRPLLPTPYAVGVHSVIPGPDRLLADGPEWVTHLKGAVGQVLVSQAVGKGEVVWLAGPYALSNGGIGTADNAAFVTSLVASGRTSVFFDEYHHGFVKTPGIWELSGPGGRSAMVLLAASLAILLIALGRRIAAPVPEVPEQAARGTAYIGSLAELYRKAGAKKEALESLDDGLRRALARARGSTEAGLSRHPAAREALSVSAEARASERMSDDKFVAVARQLHAARQEVEGHDG